MPTTPTLVWLTPALATLLLYGLGQGLVKKYVGDVSPARFCLFFVVARTFVGMGFFLTQDHPPLLDPQGYPFLLCSLAVYVMDGVAWILYYRSILVGPISIVGTLSAAYPAVTVVMASIFLHEQLTPHQYAGVLLVLGGCMGMAYSPPDPEQPGGGRAWIPLAAGALVLWGTAFTLLKYAYLLPQASEANTMVALVVGGWMTLGVYGLLYGRVPAHEGPHPARTREWLHAMIPMGMMAGGDAGLIVATASGPVSIVAPLTGAYPVVTILFARLFLKEEVTRLQYASIAAAILGMILVTVFAPPEAPL